MAVIRLDTVPGLEVSLPSRLQKAGDLQGAPGISKVPPKSRLGFPSAADGHGRCSRGPTGPAQLVTLPRISDQSCSQDSRVHRPTVRGCRDQGGLSCGSTPGASHCNASPFEGEGSPGCGCPLRGGPGSSRPTLPLKGCQVPRETELARPVW